MDLYSLTTDNYRVELRNPLPSSSTSSSSSSWNDLNELEQILRKRGTEMSTLNAEAITYRETSTLKVAEARIVKEEIQQTDQFDFQLKDWMFGTPNAMPSHQRTRTTQSQTDDIAMERQIGQALSNELTQLGGPSCAQTDQYSLYGELLAKKLRNLPKRARTILTNKIDNLLFAAEMREIDSRRQLNISTQSTSIQNRPFYYVSQSSPPPPPLPPRPSTLIPPRNRSKSPTVNFFIRGEQMPATNSDASSSCSTHIYETPDLTSRSTQPTTSNQYSSDYYTQATDNNTDFEFDKEAYY